MRPLSIVFLSLFPVLGHTEVMDKEFSLAAVCLWGLIGGGLMFFAARLKPLLLFILIPVIGLFLFAHLSEQMDPHIGPAIAAEGGQFYVFISWATPVLVLVCGVMGFIHRRRNVKPNI